MFSQNLQLLDGCRAVYVAGHQEWAAALFDQSFTQFGDSGGFACPLQAHRHKHGRVARGKIELAFRTTHQSRHFIMHNFYDLLTRGQALQDFLPYGPLFNPADKILDYFKVDIGFQ